MWKAKVKDQLLVHMYVWSLLCGREVSIQVRLERMVFMAKNNLRSDLRVYDFKKIFMAGVCTSSRVFERGRDPCSRRSSQRSSLNTSQILLSLSHWSHSKGTKASLIRIGWSHQPVPAVNLSLKSVHLSDTIYNRGHLALGCLGSFFLLLCPHLTLGQESLQHLHLLMQVLFLTSPCLL